MIKRIKAVIKSIPRFSDKNQSRAFGNLLRFFALMLVLTIIARGASASVLPKVHVSVPSRAEITEGYSGYANISAGRASEISVPEGLTILQMLVGAGQMVAAGDPIARFDISGLNERIIIETAALDKLNLEFSKLTRDETADAALLESAKLSLLRAEEDFKTIKAQCSSETAAAAAAFAEAEKKLTGNVYYKAVNAAEKNLEQARNEREDIKANGENEVAAAQKVVDDCEAVYAAAPAGSLKDAALAELILAETALIDAITQAASELLAADNKVQTAKDTLAKAEQDFLNLAGQTKEALESEYERCRVTLAAAKNKESDALLSAERRVEDARASLAKAQDDLLKNQTQVADTTEQNRINAATLKLDIEKQKNTVALLDKLYNDAGVLYSDMSGEVTQTINEGEMTGKAPLLTFADGNSGYEATLILNQNEAKSFSVGDECLVSTGGGNLYFIPTVTGSVKSISMPDAADMVDIVIHLTEGDFTRGQRVQIRTVTNRDTYNSAVPLSALHSDSTGYFIYAAETRVTVLGAENIVVRLPVELLASDDNMAAISGPVDRATQIITGSDKPFESGDRVRVEE